MFYSIISRLHATTLIPDSCYFESSHPFFQFFFFVERALSLDGHFFLSSFSFPSKECVLCVNVRNMNVLVSESVSAHMWAIRLKLDKPAKTKANTNKNSTHKKTTEQYPNCFLHIALLLSCGSHDCLKFNSNSLILSLYLSLLFTPGQSVPSQTKLARIIWYLEPRYIHI